MYHRKLERTVTTGIFTLIMNNLLLIKIIYINKQKKTLIIAKAEYALFKTNPSRIEPGQN